jgi:phenylalanyl-tRNA synthetase alpha chain
VSPTAQYAKSVNVEHSKIEGVVRSFSDRAIVQLTCTTTTFLSLSTHQPIARTARSIPTLVLTDEGTSVFTLGTAEKRVYNALACAEKPLDADGVARALGGDEAAGALAKVGINQCMKLKWIAINKADKSYVVDAGKRADVDADASAALLGRLDALDDAQVKELKKRNLLKLHNVTEYEVARGAKFTTAPAALVSDITVELLASGAWKTADFKPHNMSGLGQRPDGGSLHPLLKVRTEYRQIFLEMGFQEMRTNRWIESAFWNFDALFQPQQHPARDAHDTFFIADPASGPAAHAPPADYVERVKTMHEVGGAGSIGYRYEWAIEEARKNILRTHTTAVTTRTLFELAQTKPEPLKFFSIDRVFRNEALDATHLAEFHQIEGCIIGPDLTLGDLIGTIEAFFKRVGMHAIKFKPAYNPYTEPSMEIFAYHPILRKWVEIGNSGMFRPEMLLPMGLPPNYRVIAWGFGLERPTMIRYAIKNIRDLCGHKLDLSFVRSNPACRIDK